MISIKIDRAEILKTLSVANEIILIKGGHHNYDCVLLTINDGTLMIQATDGKICFESTIKVEGSGEGKLLLNSHNLYAAAQNINAEVICIDQFESNQVKIFSSDDNNLEYKFFSYSLEGFPTLDQMSTKTYSLIDQRKLKYMIDQTIFSVSNEDSRYNINGVHIKKKEDVVDIVATDSKRLSIISTQEVPTLPDEFIDGITVPTKLMSLVEKHCGDEGSIGLAIDGKMIFVNIHDYYMSSIVIPGDFPNYERVIPAEHKHQVVVNREKMVEILKRVSLFCNSSSKAEAKYSKALICLETNSVEIYTNQSQQGSAKDVTSCEYDGPEEKIAINYNYLLDPIMKMHSKNISIGFTERNRALTISGQEDAELQHVVMPMQTE